MNGWEMYRSLTRDRSVTDKKVNRTLVRRILGYALKYRPLIIVFLILMVLASLLSVAQPLMIPRLVDDGINAGNRQVVTVMALLIALLAILDAGLGLIVRWYSSRIGEGLIYDLRTEVYDHVQRQSIAFFTRAQTGALISRLNNDVIGAQQAFTSTLGGVLGNLISVVIVLTAMFILSWQITLVSLILVPLFLLPARWMGRKLQGMTREQMGINADMSTQMTERFNVAGALLVKLFGRPEDEAASFSARAAPWPTAGSSPAWFSSLLSPPPSSTDSAATWSSARSSRSEPCWRSSGSSRSSTARSLRCRMSGSTS